MKAIARLHIRSNCPVIGRIFRQGLALSALGMAILAGAPAGADPSQRPTASIAVLASPSQPPARAATSAQRALAAAAETEDVQVEWNSELGAPFSIRGKNLGARRSFSAGQGLQLSKAARPEANAIAVLDNLSGIMGIRNAQSEFAARPATSDKLGFRHVRAGQTYQGLKVFGGEVIVHFNQEGAAYQVNGRYVPDIDIDVTPALSPDDAASIATVDLAALGKTGITALVQPELVVFAYKTAPHLAYALTLTCEPEPANAWRYWVDAQDGKALMRYNDVKQADITGVILAGEGGTTQTVYDCYSEGVTNYLINTNWNWLVFNYSTDTNYPDAFDYAFRTNTTWLPEDRVEMSAAYNFDQIQQYYRNVHGRNSYDNEGAYAWIYVHFGNKNAFWSGSAFVFGDGDNVTANPLAVLDVCAHEFTHAVTEYSANLIYAYEPGALNESFSDIFGACVEFAVQPDGRTNYPGKAAGTADWLMGEDYWLSSTALRDMRSPTNTITVGRGNEQPNYYKGRYWYPGDGDNGGVHYNNSVQNYFFYLLSDGMPGVVTGIGVSNAADIAYRTLTFYCSPYTDFTDIRSAWMSAAQDLYAPWTTSVAQAWDQVGYGSYVTTNLGTALNADYLTWKTAGDKAWFAQTNTTRDGVLAAQSGRIKDGQQSRLQTTVTGPGTLSFWWKVSSELGYDFLRFSVDGQETNQISGNADWALYSIYLGSGSHTGTWNYTKDSSVSNGTDAGWVDQVSWAPVWTPTVPAITATKGDYADRISITWPAVSGATDYLLYRHTINNSAQSQLLATLTSPSYNDTGVVPGTIYYYWMKARNCATLTSFSSVDTGYRNLLAPTALSASKGSYTGYVRLTWVAASGATSYRIMRSTSPDTNSATAIIETGATSYLDTTALPSVTYYYWLTARKWRPEGLLTTAFSAGDYGWRRSMASTANALCDFDGDGCADPAVYQSATGQWLVMMSGNRYRTATYTLGGAGYQPVPQDYDGDGKTDIAVYSPAGGQWIVLLSSRNNERVETSLGGAGYIPLPRDYDGDSLADPAVFHQSSGLWKIQFSSLNYTLIEGNFGNASFTPCPADFDNDGKTDPAVFQARAEMMGRAGYLFAAQSSMGYAAHNWTIGASGRIVPQDYDGDGKADPALFDADTARWSYWPSSMISAMPVSFSIGGVGWIPAGGDYDGDGKADPAVYQESTGIWLVLLSKNNYAPVSVSLGGAGYEAAAALPQGF